MKHRKRPRQIRPTVHTLVNSSLTALACASAVLCGVDCSVAHITSGSGGATTHGAGGATSSSVASSGSGGDAAGGNGQGGVGGSPVTYAELVMADHPIAYWRFEQVSPGGLAADETGNFDGTYVGAPTGVPIAVAGSISGMETAVEGDGVDIGAYIPFEGAEESYSVEVWIQPLQTDSPNRRIVTNIDCCANGWFMWLQAGTITFGRSDSNMTYFQIGSDPQAPISNAQPTYVVGVYDAANDEICVWLNGAKSACKLGSLAFDLDSVNLGFAASNDPQHQFYGVIDELAIYDKVLDETQIVSHHQAGLGP